MQQTYNITTIFCNRDTLFGELVSLIHNYNATLYCVFCNALDCITYLQNAVPAYIIQ